MPIDPAALARSVSALTTLDAERDLARAIQHVTSVARGLFGSDGAGLMLVDEGGALRWASASEGCPARGRASSPSSCRWRSTGGS
ncbi:MAG TPA: hypothetical protein VF995_00955 [Actinomycetota bacterium]